jgi:hypothetical protein
MDTACSPSSGCYCQLRTGVEKSYPTKITRFVANEADPGWPDYIGNKGYAAHLAARGSQHSCAQSRNATQSRSNSISNTSTTSLLPTSRSSTPLPWQRSDWMLLGQGDSDPRSQPQPAPKIQIVDRSPEVLAEMRMLEMMERFHLQMTPAVSEEHMLMASVQEEFKESKVKKKGKHGERRRKKKKYLRKLRLKLWQQR